MAESHELTQAAADRRPPRKVVVTGAAGRIGSFFAEHSHDRYDLTLIDRPGTAGLDALGSFGRVETADLSELDRLKDLFAGHDTLVHLAADPSPRATWDSVVTNNITGTYHALVAAKAAGCGRVVYASSIHAVSGYPGDRQVHTTDPPNPGDLYGVSKRFGEALARYMADQEGLSAICIRIGAFQPVEKAREDRGINMLDAFVSRRDLNQLIQRCIDAQGVRFAIVHGLSDNAFKRMDLTDTCELLGYQPQDDAARENPELAKLELDHRLSGHNRQSGQDSGIRNEL